MTRITVGLITTPLTSGHAVRGIGMYTKFLLENLKKLPSGNLEIVSLADKPSQKSWDNLDLLHYPFFDLFFPTLKLFGNLPIVVTIHDVTPLKFPTHYPPGIKGRLNFLRQKASLAKVSAVITDSQTSKKDITAYLHIPSEKIYAVPLASQISSFPSASDARSLRVKKKYNLPDKFVLFVGDVNWNKNLVSLVKGAKIAGLPVVMVGKQAADQTLLSSSNIELESFRHFIYLYGNDPAVIRTGFVPPEELAAIYSLATVYCQPSFWEGFGMSCLEAVTAGCPVVASDTPPLIDLLGKAAIYVDPQSTDSIASGIIKAETPSLRNRIITLGKTRAKRYSWTRTARETLAVYRKVSQKP